MQQRYYLASNAVVSVRRAADQTPVGTPPDPFLVELNDGGRYTLGLILSRPTLLQLARCIDAALGTERRGLWPMTDADVLREADRIRAHGDEGLIR